MLSSIRGVEYVKLLGSSEGAARRAGPTWDDAYRELKDKLTADPVTKKHQAVSLMLKLLIASFDGSKPAAGALKESDPAFVTDAENRLTRLARWGLEDFTDAGKQPPTKRFLLARSIFDSTPPITTSTLYNTHLTRQWHDIVRRYVVRPDAAANYTLWLEHARTTDHYRALEILRTRMTQLRDALRNEGHNGAADQCTAWLVQTFKGLMQSERDCGTRLLCADLIVRTIGMEAEAAHAMKRLRVDFHAHADRCLGDMSAPDKPPVTDPDGYRSTIRWLIAAGALQAVAVGAFLMLVAAAVFAVFRRRVTDSKPPVQLSGLAMIPYAVMAAAGCLAPIWLSLRDTDTILFSLLSALVCLDGVVMLGAALVLFHATRSWQTAGAAKWLPILLIATAIFLFVLPASVLSQVSTFLGEPVVLPILLTVIILLLLAVSLVVVDVPAARLAHSAIVLFLVSSVLSFVAIIAHLHADGQYLQKVAAQRMDEFAARLGEEWEATYLPGLSVHESPRPAPTHGASPG